MKRGALVGGAVLVVLAAALWLARHPSPHRRPVPSVTPGAPREARLETGPGPQGGAALDPQTGETPSAPVASRSVSGKVLDEEERPTSAAVAALLDGETVADERRGEAGADGAFSLSLATGRWWLHAEADDRMSRPKPANVYEERGKEDIELTLRPTGRVWGFVYDPEGRPSSGARILSLSRPEWSGLSFGGNRRPSPAPSCLAEADASGRYEVRASEGEVVVQADAEGLSPACATVEVAADQAVQVDLRLRKGVTAHGRVLGTDGRPIQGAEVDVSFDSDIQREVQGLPLPYPDRYYLQSDAEGRYRSPRPWDGEVSVSARKNGYGSAEGEADEADPGLIDVTLVRSSVIEGAVRMRGGGAPPAGTRLGLRRTKYPRGQFFDVTYHRPDGKPRDGGDGAFRLEDIAPDLYVVQAQVDGVARGESAEFDVSEGQTVRGVDVELRTSCSIRGTVRLARTGEPVPRAGVGLVAGEEGKGGRVGGGTADERGRFEIQDLEPGSYRIRASSGTLVAADMTVELREGEASERDVLLAEGARVRGRVLQDGGTLKEFIVIAHPLDLLDMRNGKHRGDGSYEVGGLRPGPWYISLHVYSDDHAKDHYLARLIEVVDQAEIPLDFDLHSAPRARGTVRQAGAPLRSRSITFVGRGPLDGWIWSTELNESGEFDIRGLPAGDHVVIIPEKLKAALDRSTGRHRVQTDPADPVVRIPAGDVDSLLIELPADR